MAILYSGTEGTCPWTIDDQGHLYIGSGVISHNTDSYMNWSWYSYKANIISVSSGNVSWANGANACYMFYACRNLTSLDLSNFHTSNVTSMHDMFGLCQSLASLNLSSFDTSNVTNMAGMFYNCEVLTSLDISNFNTSNVTNMSNMFNGCKSLILLNVSNFNTSNVTHMTKMFDRCEALTSLDVSNFDTSNVTTMDWMFGHCLVLTILNVSNFNTSNVTTMRAMFNCDYNLTKIKGLMNFDTSNVTNMRYMFANDESVDSMSLTSLNLSSFDTSQVTDMQEMFSNCQFLETIYVSDKWSIDAIENSTDMFKDCISLIGEQDTSYDSSYVDKTYAHIDGGISSPGYFTNEDSLPEAYASFDSISGELKIFRDLENEYDINGVGEVIGNITYWSGIEDITGNTYPKWVGIRADIQSVRILNKFSPKTTYNMFVDCEQLTSLDLSNFDTSSVTTMRGMFHHCNSLASLDLSNFDTNNVTDMANMFGDCLVLTTLNVSSFNTSNVTTMRGMFYGCSSLTSLDLSSFDTSNIIDMGYMFESSYSLTLLNLSSFDTSNVTDMSYMFSNCTALQYIIVSNLWNINAVTNSNYMFLNCRLLHGGAGTTYDSSNIDVSMAHIDEGESNPGYLVHINNTEMYASFDSDNGQLTIFRDIKGEYDSSGTGEVRGTVTYWSGIEDITGNTNPKWYSKRSSIQSVQIINKFSPKTAYHMFMNCNNNNLTSLNLLNLDTSNITDMGQMFRECRNLTSLNLSNFDTSNVIDMNNMFYRCTSLTSLNLSNFDTSNVTDMKGMFDDCQSLTSLEISNFDTGNVTNMANMFDDCQSLISLDLSNFNTSNVTDMRYMFGDCYNLTSLNLYNFDTSNVTNMSGMFYSIGVQIIIVSSLWTTSALLESQDMFWACLNLVGENGTSYDSSHVDGTYAHIDGGVSNPGYLTDINSVPCYASFNSDTEELKIFRDVAGKYDSSGFGEVIGNTTYWSGIEDITGYTNPKWYAQRINIQSVQILNKFSPKTAYNMFADCEQLTSLNLLNLDTSNVTNMTCIFNSCTSLTSLDLSNFNTSNVITMRAMFNNCELLTSLNLSSFDTSNVTDMSNMFYNCQSLDYLELYVNGEYNSSSFLTNIFTGTPSNREYYIINKGAADATFWRNVASQHNGVHYEADDLTIIFNTTQGYAPIVQRRNLSINTTKFMDPYVDISFYYQTNNLLPHSWDFNISQIKGYLQGETSLFLDDNSPSTSISNQHYTKTVEYFKNNKAQTVLELYATIIDAQNVTKINNQLMNSITTNFIGYNKPIISHNSNIFIDEDDEDNKFLYQIIGSTQQVGVCAHNETYNYNNVTIPTEVIFDGNTYTVTKLNINIYNVNGNSTIYGCFENNTTVTGINSISTNITNIDRSFYGCNALEGNIIFLPTNNISYINAFTNTTKNIFLIDSNNPDNITDNPVARNIAYAFSNVHYEADDNVAPTIPVFNVPTQRRIYNQETHTWEDNDDGEWIPATIKINLASNSLPVGWTNEIKSFNCTANSTNINLKTEDYQDVTKNDFITTPEGDPTIIYIEIGTQAVMLEFTVIDRFGKTITITRKINPIFAMLDFMPGGQGMSIGKIANRNGLDIAIPTAIGEGLLLPTVVNSNSVDLTKYQLVVGQYNQQNNDAIFIIGNGLNINNPSNLLEINAKLNENSLIFGSNPGIRGNLTITLGENLMAEYSNQIVIGKNNNNLSTSAFEIGNGLDNNNRSNAITIDWNGNITRGDGASYTAVQITRWI